MAQGECLEHRVAALATPEVRADRCVHTLIETASCRRCVDVCPTQAWVIDDSQLGIDFDRCDGCKLCVAACSEEALSAPEPATLRRWEDGWIGLAACDRVEAGHGEGRVACLHSIGLLQLARWYRQGVRRLLVSRGDCAECSRGQGPRVQELLSPFNQLLRERGLPQLLLVELPAAQWRGVEAMTRGASDVSRRVALQRVGLRAAEWVLNATQGEVVVPGDPAVSPGTLLQRSDEMQRACFAPSIDPARCNGCDACIKVCRHGALSYDGAAGAYRIEADHCTGCQVCHDVCDAVAIRVEQWRQAPAATVPLEQATCSSCGVAFHRPTGSNFTPHLCNVCVVNKSKSNLYQILA